MIQAIRDLSEYLRGWVSYFRIREFRKVFKDLDGFIRRRSLHAVEEMEEAGQVSADDDSRGVPGGRSEADLAQDEQRAIGGTTAGAIVLNLDWFRRRSLLFLDDFMQRKLKLAFAR